MLYNERFYFRVSVIIIIIIIIIIVIIIIIIIIIVIVIVIVVTDMVIAVDIAPHFDKSGGETADALDKAVDIAPHFVPLPNTIYNIP